MAAEIAKNLRKSSHFFCLVICLLMGQPLQAQPDLRKQLLLQLGGIDFSLGIGRATVSSSSEDLEGKTQEVAHGVSRQGRLGITFFSVPQHNGWFLSPSPGYLSQRILLSDFEQNLSSADSSQGTDIAATCSDPDTGNAINCGIQNTYNLTLQSFYLGLSGGYKWHKSRSTRVQRFASTSARLNLVEYRRLHAQLDSYESVSEGLNVAASGSLGATAGLYFPKGRWALRYSADLEVFKAFTFSEALLFKGPVTYNEDKDIYEQPLTEVYSTSLNTITHRLSLVYVF